MASASASASAPAPAPAYPMAPFGRTISNTESLKQGPEYLAFNEQVLRFLFLADTLSKAGLCAPDVKACMHRYVTGIHRSWKEDLEIHFPHLDVLKKRKSEWAPTLAGFASLGNGLSKELVLDALRAARLRAIEYPAWVQAPGSWFFTFAKRRHDKPFFQDGKLIEVIDRFYLPQWEAAIWLVFMARLTLLFPAHDEFLATRRRAYREAWWGFFGLLGCEWHFDKFCECKDKHWAFSDELYATSEPNSEESAATVALLKEPLKRLLNFGSAEVEDLNVQALCPAVIKWHWPAEWVEYEDHSSVCKTNFCDVMIEGIKKDHPGYDHAKKSKPQANKAKGERTGPALKTTSLVLPVTRLPEPRPLKPSAKPKLKAGKTKA